MMGINLPMDLQKAEAGLAAIDAEHSARIATSSPDG
jgi:hypothetical protein